MHHNSLKKINIFTISKCARDGNRNNMKRVLDSLQGNVEKVNKHDDEDLSALHYAARYNHYHIVKMLIDAGASK